MSGTAWVEAQLTLIRESLDTVDKLFEINDPDADEKAHHILNVAIPGIRKRLNQHVIGSGRDVMNDMLDDHLVTTMKAMASKHGLNMAMDVKSDEHTSTDPKDWLIK